MSARQRGKLAKHIFRLPLPPTPPLKLTGGHHGLLEKANRALGRLDGMTLILPDPSLFLYFYVRKEALLSSQIEGTQSSFNDLLLYESEEMPGVSLEDVQEVSNYVAAMNHGLGRIRDRFPISLRLIKEIHGVLLSRGRGSDKEPGEFRRSQNWIGGTRPGNAAFVPPPPEYLMDCLGRFEKFIHNDPVATPVLIKAALAHVQFETIHPFLDGNGRVMRHIVSVRSLQELNRFSNRWWSLLSSDTLQKDLEGSRPVVLISGKSFPSDENMRGAGGNAEYRQGSNVQPGSYCRFRDRAYRAKTDTPLQSTNPHAIRLSEHHAGVAQR